MIQEVNALVRASAVLVRACCFTPVLTGCILCVPVETIPLPFTNRYMFEVSLLVVKISGQYRKINQDFTKWYDMGTINRDGLFLQSRPIVVSIL